MCVCVCVCLLVSYSSLSPRVALAFDSLAQLMQTYVCHIRNWWRVAAGARFDPNVGYQFPSPIATEHPIVVVNNAQTRG